MSRFLRRVLPVIALCMATLLGGCIVVPEHHHWYGGGYGWRR